MINLKGAVEMASKKRKSITNINIKESILSLRPITEIHSLQDREMLDIPNGGNTEILVRNDGKVVWINVDGICVCRLNNVKDLYVEDMRKDG